MTARPSRASTTQRRPLVLAGIAAAIGGSVLLARHLDDWTRQPGEDLHNLPLLRAVAVTLAQPLRQLEWKTYDFVHAHSYAAKTPADPDVMVLGIDEPSLGLENSSAFPEDIEASRPLQLMNRLYPWSREVYAQLIDRLVAAGAQTIVIDLMFPAASEADPEGDALLHECLDRHAGRVILAADVVAQKTRNGMDDTIQVHLPYSGLIEHRWPVDPRIGYVSYWPDADGVIREASFRLSLDPRLPEKTLYSFAAATLRSQGLGDRLPADEDWHYVRFGDRSAYEPVSLHEVFVPALWEQNFGGGTRFAGKTIFLGVVARQQQDFHPTPLGVIAGVRIHAHVYAAAKAGQLLQALPPWASFVLIAAAAVLAWALITLCRRPVLAGILLLGGLAWGLVAQMLLFNHAALVVNTSTPLLAFGLIGLAGFSYDFLLERRQKLALKRSVMRFHSPDVAEQIVQHPEFYYSIRQGANRSIVVLFSDIRGYTSMSEQLTAQEMVSQLNEYFERMVAIVFQRQGAVDKFIGDAMMAVWGRFRDHPREEDLVADACLAVDAALAMREALVRLNDRWRELGITELSIGIGIHQGEAVVGEIGSHERAELTAIGDCVNLSSRLEGATKEYSLDLLISEVVHARVASRFLCRTADLIRVKGKRQPVEVFAVLGPKGQPAPPGLEAYEQGMSRYRQGQFTQARQHFQDAATAGLDDELTTVFLKRSAELDAHPPDHWDGVYTMTKK